LGGTRHMTDTDVQNVSAIQDKMIVKPLSEFQGNTTTSPSTVTYRHENF